MTPYYEHGGITIYNGDCRKILPCLSDECVDLVCTDPPYVGMNDSVVVLKQGGVGRDRRNSQTIGMKWNVPLIHWTDQVWRCARYAVLSFCSYHFVSEFRHQFPQSKPINLLTWHKRNAPNPVANAPRYTTEFIWALQKKPGLDWRALKTSMFDIPNLTAGCVSTGERFVDDTGRSEHPSQKPISLLMEILAIGGQSVLDPFAGSGTTLYAAKQLGKKAIGIEIEERYCEIAAKRLSQEVFEFNEVAEVTA